MKSLDDIVPAAEVNELKTEIEPETKPIQTITLIFKVPQERVPDLTLEYKEVELPGTILDLKKEICSKHSFKPSEDKQKLLFRGKLLSNQESLKEVIKAIAEPKIFHLIIFQSLESLKEKEA